MGMVPVAFLLSFVDRLHVFESAILGLFVSVVSSPMLPRQTCKPLYLNVISLFAPAPPVRKYCFFQAQEPVRPLFSWPLLSVSSCGHYHMVLVTVFLFYPNSLLCPLC